MGKTFLNKDVYIKREKLFKLKNMRKSITLTMLLLISITVANAQRLSGYNLAKGDKFTMTVKTDVTTNQQAMGQSIETSQIISATDELEVTDVKGDVYTIKNTTVRKTVSIQSPMMSTEMDSDLEGEQNLPFKIMTGKSYSFRMNKKGQILELIGLDVLKSEVKKEMAGTPFAGTADQILTVFDYETIKSNLEAQFTLYTDAGKDEWSTNTKTVVSNIPVEYANNFRWDNNNTILAEAKIDLNGSTDAAGMTMKMALDGDQQTIYDLDQKTGFPAKIQTQQSMTGNMEAQGMQIPMTIKTAATTTIEKK